MRLAHGRKHFRRYMAENMINSTSPRLKTFMVFITDNDFTVGLVEVLFSHLMFSQMDIFIEKPFCSLNFKSASRLIDQCETNQS